MFEIFNGIFDYEFSKFDFEESPISPQVLITCFLLIHLRRKSKKRLDSYGPFTLFTLKPISLLQ